MIPYLMMMMLYVVLATLIAFGSSLLSWQLIPGFSGHVWLRVHLITLGIFAQLLFGLLPFLLAIRHKLSRPPTRWDIWFLLNAAIITLLIGMPLISRTLIILGGSLAFVATILLIRQLAELRPVGTKADPVLTGRKFYLAGFAYFLIGILIGTGLFVGWSEPLGVVGNAKEVHIHANSWGLISLVFAGLLFDYLPVWTGRKMATARQSSVIFWLMTAGAFGLVFGPWFGARSLLVPGLLLHLTATIWLLILAVRSVRASTGFRRPGYALLLTSYVWIVAPVLMAPFVLFEVEGVPGNIIEATAPQALIYGWVLQFGIAVLPFFVTRALNPEAQPGLAGTWSSYVLINFGSVLLWLSIFIEPWRTWLHGGAYGAWMLALIPLAWHLFKIGRDGFSRLEAIIVNGVHRSS